MPTSAQMKLQGAAGSPDQLNFDRVLKYPTGSVTAGRLVREFVEYILNPDSPSDKVLAALNRLHDWCQDRIEKTRFLPTLIRYNILSPIVNDAAKGEAQHIPKEIVDKLEADSYWVRR